MEHMSKLGLSSQRTATIIIMMRVISELFLTSNGILFNLVCCYGCASNSNGSFFEV